MEKSSKNTYMVALSVAIILGVVFMVAIYAQTNPARFRSCESRGKQPQYWEEAPDGKYEVFVVLSLAFDGSSLSFPNCPSYGGQLHGTWSLQDGTPVVFQGWALATVDDNVIVALETLEK